MKSRHLERSAVGVLLAAYILVNIPLLFAKVTTCEHVHVFSVDEWGICTAVTHVLQTRSFTAAGSDPYPYGQLYQILIGGPLLLLQTVMTISETLIIRWAVVVLILSGAAVLGMTYKTCARLYPWPYALLATILMLTVPEFWRWSHELHPDLPQLAFLVTGFYFCVRLYETPVAATWERLKYLSLASLCAGLAMAAKFNGVFLLPVIAVAYNRPFAMGFQRARLRAWVTQNLIGGSLCVLLFAATFFVFNPFLVVNHVTAEPFSRAAGLAQSQATGGYSLGERLSNILYSNYNMERRVAGGMYILSLCGIAYGLGRLVRRYPEEIATPKILSEVFLVVFLTYSFGIGYGLVQGKLLAGYERYLLPAVPFLCISAMRVVSLIVNSPQLPSMVSLSAVALLLLVVQSNLISDCYSNYVRQYLQREAGNFRVYEWIEKNVPKHSVIYTEKYIYVPTEDYYVIRRYAVHSYDVMRLSDYVITKTLNYSVYADPDRWERYDSGLMRESKQLYELLEGRGLPGFERVATLGIGNEDTVVVYKNLAPADWIPPWQRVRRASQLR